MSALRSNCCDSNVVLRSDADPKICASLVCTCEKCGQPCTAALWDHAPDPVANSIRIEGAVEVLRSSAELYRKQYEQILFQEVPWEQSKEKQRFDTLNALADWIEGIARAGG